MNLLLRQLLLLLQSDLSSEAVPGSPPLGWVRGRGSVLLLLCHPMHSLGPTGIPLSPFTLQVFLIQPLCPWLRESPQGPSFLSFSCSLCTPCSLKCLPSHFSLISWQCGHFPFSFLSDFCTPKCFDFSLPHPNSHLIPHLFKGTAW